jgi:hypothetical protein
MNTNSDSVGEPGHRPPFASLRGALYVLGFVLAGMVTIVALAWAIENWRGARAWAAVRRDLAARGEPLSFSQLLPPAPPDDQNFAATPLLRGLFDYNRTASGPGQSLWRDPQGQARVIAIALPPSKEPRSARFSDRTRRPSASDEHIDLMSYALGIRLRPQDCPPTLDPALAERYGFLPPGVKWHKPTNEVEIAASIKDPAREVLDFLNRFEPELQEIEQAARRPYSQFPIHYSEGYNALLPHLAPLKQFDTMFSVRSAARLHEGDTNGAFHDALTCLRLAKTLRSEPLLISQLVDCAEHAIAIKAMWQGLASHQWSAEQLAAFQNELASFNFQTQAVAAIRGDRAGHNEFLDQFWHQGRSSLDAISPEEPREGVLLLAIPWVPGWIRQNQLRINRYDEIELRQISNPQWPASMAGRPDPTAARDAAGLNEVSPYTVVARLLAPNLFKVHQKAARAQTLNRLATTACALERFRLAHAAYPKELAELKPFEQPGSYQDPMSGAPLRYELDGSTPAEFRLWSVGLNGHDDGGVMLDKDNDAQGDWVWPQPGTPGLVWF